MNHLNKQLNVTINQQHIWSDSKTALQWSKTSGNLPIFIQNRVKTIKKNASNAILRYVPTNVNPADIGSRGSTIADLRSNDLWWNGPPFLQLDTDKWPEDISEGLTIETVSAAITTKEDEPIIDNTLPYRTWTSLLNVMQMVLLFLANIRAAIAKKKGTNIQSPNYNAAATVALFRQAQLHSPISSSQKTSLRAYFDDNCRVWRSRGRTNNSSLSFDANNPIILPRRNWITELYILHQHMKCHHIGTSQTLTMLRQQVWIPQGRVEVRRVIKKFCFYCRKEKAKPFHLPPFPDHPIERVQRPSYPFFNSAVDYLGPFALKISNENSKVWIALFTCLNTRAIYVDIANSLSASCFLHILRRFIATNGTPKYLMSDNAPAFTAVSEVMSSTTSTQCQDVIDYCSAHNIRFKFIAALAPWQGGVYERMIGIFKTSFKAAIQNQILDYDEFVTLMKECEAIVNSRPITYVYSDIDSGYPLRPIDFLRPLSIVGSPRLVEENDDDDEWKPDKTPKDFLHKQWNTTLTLLNRFWQRWNEEYLTNLRERFQHEHKQPFHTSQESPFDDQIVLVHDDTRPRGQWKLGRIMSHSETSATVRLPSGNTISRPLSLLYPLEIPPTKQSSSASSTSKSEKEQDKEHRRRNTTRSHPMITRNLARQLSTSFSILLICFIVSASSSAVPDTKCTNSHSAKHIIHADQCSSNGIAIAITTTLSNMSAMCWFPITCPLGHIRITLPVQPNSKFCDEKCNCPQWTTTCSHYDGILKETSKYSSIPVSIIMFLPPHVCSFSPSALCSSEQRLGVFHQIQLFDDTLIVVPELHIQSADFLAHDDFYCFNIDGNKTTKPHPSSTTGTPAYCRRHQCRASDEANTFCAYPTPAAVYHHKNISIVIQAWGTTTRTYYPALETLPLKTHTLYTIPRCTTGGVVLETTETFQMVEACSSFTCIYISNYSPDTKILLPTSVTLFQHTVKLSAWKDGKQVFANDLTCEGKPICDLIECFFCWEHAFNLQCWTTTELIITATVSLLSLIACHLLSPVLKCFWWLFKKLLRMLRKFIDKITPCRRRHDKYVIPHFPSYQQTATQRLIRKTPIITLVLHLISTSSACSDVVSISGTVQHCKINSTNEECEFDQAVTLQLQPVGQDVCLLLRNYKNEPTGVISIRIHDIAYSCQERTEYYTRDHKFYTESHHQCWNTKSCKGETCSGITTSTNIYEFSHYAKNNPGYTYCSPSCKCLWCDFCFWCKETCLFYKVYAWPKSETIYRIFTCPVWSITITGTITLKTSTKDEEHNFVLNPARPHVWNSIELTLTATTVPNLPILSSYFLTDGSTVTKVEPSPAGIPLPNSVGQLQCTSEETAKKILIVSVFACYVPMQPTCL
ncbi:hypothetical protein V3C99_000352 [Haemonchus contortus]